MKRQLRKAVPSGGIDPKPRSFKFFERVPIIGETGDPEAAGILTIIVVVTVAAFVFAHHLLPHDNNASSHVLQIAAGIVVLVGAYLTAVGVRNNRAEQYVGRLSTTIGLLGSSSEPVKLGAMRCLQAMAYETPNVPSDARASIARHKRAIGTSLGEIANEGAGKPALLALEILNELRHEGLLPATEHAHPIEGGQ